MESQDTCLVLRLSQDMVFHFFGLGSVLTLVYFILALSRVSMSRHVSCLMIVLTLFLSGIAKYLFCAEILAFLAESRPLGPFTCCLLTCHKTIVFAVVL